MVIAEQQLKGGRMSNTSERAVVITAIVAIIVAVITQAVAVYNQRLIHKLTQQRETEKYYNEVYQKLFAPAIPNVFLYIDIVANFMRGHDSTPELEIVVKDRAIASIRENLHYASPLLIAMYHHIENSKYSDWSGLNPSRSELVFLYNFVCEYEHVIQRASIFLGRDKEEQLAPVHERMILYLLHVNRYESMTSFSWTFDRAAYTAKNHRKIAAILRKAENEHAALLRQEEAKRKNFKKSVEGKEEDVQNELINQHSSALRVSQDDLGREVVVGTVRGIVKLLISDPDNREMVINSTLEEKYQLSPDSE